MNPHGSAGSNTRQSTPAQEESSIVRHAAAGDPKAFEWIMRHYNQRLYRLARAMLNNNADAKDALQDAYLAAYRSLVHFRGDASLYTWLARIVLNQCTARWRRERRRGSVVQMVSLYSDSDTVNRIIDSAEQPDDSLARTQMHAILARKIDELPAALRVVFVMRSVEELSVAETAEALGITEESVRIRHFRARSLLREQLAQLVESAQRDLYEFGDQDCDQLVANVLARIDG
jgi:RNA polymerase sigma-70 factor (ECF subfamily)